MSIESIRPIQNAFLSVEGNREQNLFKRVWNSVANFFTNLAEQIKNGAIFVWNKLKSCCHFNTAAELQQLRDRFTVVHSAANNQVAAARQSRPAQIHPALAVETPRVIRPLQVNWNELTLNEKLDCYRVMPPAETAFMQKAINNTRCILSGIDRKLTPLLQNKLGLDSAEALAAMMEDKDAFIQQMEQRNPPIPFEELPYQLVNFDHGFEDSDPAVFMAVMEAVLRAYIFAENTITQVYFQKREGWRVVNFMNQINLLKEGFQKLPNDKKEIIIDSFNTNGNHLNLPASGKKILQDLRAISNQLSQNNADYLQRFQAVQKIIHP